MEDRIVDFIAALRAAGVRVSIAESADAMHAIEHVGVVQREAFRLALRATLVKDANDTPAFDKLFPLYFGSGGPPMQPPELGQDELRQLQQALREFSGRLAELLRRLMQGQDLTREELQQLGQRSGLEQATSMHQRPWISRRMERELGLDELQELLKALWAELARRGMDRQAIQELQRLASENQEAMAEQIDQFVGQQLARQQAEEQRHEPSVGDLMNRNFDSLNEREQRILRDEVRRLAARLRTRISLRRKRGKQGKLDAKATIRANQRFGGVPITLRLKRRRRKSRLTLICDISTSMRPAVEFLLRLVYELQDQVTQTHSFVFIDHLEEISQVFNEQRPQQAIEVVLVNMPPGHYNTDLGASLAELVKDRLGALDRRTTVIVLGDGRNNYNDPRLDAFQVIKARARRVIWLTPEASSKWGTGDSDMLRYVPLCDAVHEVANLDQLTRAVDKVLSE